MAWAERRLAMEQPGRSMFPILNDATILKFMEEVNVPLTEMELKEPGRCRERVREVFDQLVRFPVNMGIV